MRTAFWLGCLLSPASLALAALIPSTPWQRMPVGAETRIVAVAVDPADPAHVLAAGAAAVYETRDEGGAWTLVFRAPPPARLHALAFGKTALACTNDGLYAATAAQTWTRQPLPDSAARPCAVLRAEPGSASALWLGSEERLYHSRDGGVSWQRVPLPAGAGTLVDIAADSAASRAYALTTTGLFARVGASAWTLQRRLPPPDPESHPEPEAEEAVLALPAWRALALHPQEKAAVYAATEQGVWRSLDDGRTWQPMAQSGLPSPQITRLWLQAPAALYAATARGVARHDAVRQQWQALNGLAAGPIDGLAGSAQTLWAATDQGLFRLALFDERQLDFSHEPTIGQVQAAAIRYAEVHPDKIRRWRKRAAWQALLPTLSLGLDRDTARNLHYDEGTFPNFQIVETTDRDAGVDVSLNWQLGELIWNNDQTSIDTRSKLMVELREDVVDAVTRTYFERRRLQARLRGQPPQEPQAALEQALRLAELTALIDGFTGGYFSQPQEEVR